VIPKALERASFFMRILKGCAVMIRFLKGFLNWLRVLIIYGDLYLDPEQLRVESEAKFLQAEVI